MRRKSVLELPRAFAFGLTSTEEARCSSRGVKYILGVDGGATKTVAAVVDGRGHRVGMGLGGPSNRDAVGSMQAIASIRKAVDEAMALANIGLDSVVCAVLALAGIHTEKDEHWFREHIGYRMPLGLYVVNDVLGAWAAGTGCEPGIVVIAGTGSNAFGVNAKWECWRAGGWGHILGDEGSAYWIGVEGMKAALRYRDGRGPRTRLAGRVVKSYDLPSLEALPELVYGRGLKKAEVAAFASCVYDEAREGDRVAIHLFQKAGRELGSAVATIARQLEMQRDVFPVALTGSVFRSETFVRDALQKQVRRWAPKARLIDPRLPPVGGALLLAARASGFWTELDREAFKMTLPGALERNGPR